MQKNQLEIISKLVSKLPGMGPRIAKRLVLYLANNKEKILLPLIENLKILNEKISNCKICGNLDEGEICHICLDEKRDQSIICVVEEVADLWAIERAGDYHGKYHILGGNLSATSGKKIEDLNINSLIDRVRNNQVKEIIIATSATIDGQTTSYFITDLVKEYNIKITRLTYGIPVGSELDYLDEGTISIALKTRTQI